MDMLPFMKSLPDWFPGTAFKHIAQEWASTLTELTEKPYALVKQQMSQGRNQLSVLPALLEEENHKDEEEVFINKWTAMSLYTAGADTTVSSMSCFFLAMTAFPEVQRKAQEEIDRVIGSERLPTLQIARTSLISMQLSRRHFDGIRWRSSVFHI